MQKFDTLISVAAPLMISNVDTDMIIPMERYLMADRSDMHRYAFEVLRFLPNGSENPDFVLNKAPYRDAKILITGANFGCGSSRESAVWALAGLGIRCLIAPGFGNIFYNNCFQNGVLPIVLDEATVDQLAAMAGQTNAGSLNVDLEKQRITDSHEEVIPFEIEPQRRRQLLEGLDDIGVTLIRENEIKAFRAQDQQNRPWIYTL